MAYISERALRLRVFICMGVFTSAGASAPVPPPWGWVGNTEACAIQHCHSEYSKTFLLVVNIFETALKAASVCIFTFVNGFTCKFTQ